MKKLLILFLLLVCSPIVSWGYDDACSKPKEYTVDKRCYVTDEQKKEHPYNAVVAVVVDTGWCTGTIVDGGNGRKYLYTAKHCTNDENGLVRNELQIILQDGRYLTVTNPSVGDYDLSEDENFSGDWAIYSVNESDVPVVEKTDKMGMDWLDPYDVPYRAKVVGYGALKIMSDAEISEFKSMYIEYLKKQKYIDKKDVDSKLEAAYIKRNGINSDGTERKYGWYKGGVLIINDYVANFVSSLGRSYREDLFGDNRELKVSYCKYSVAHRKFGCQQWGGNSGGPIFDNNGNIMGINTRSANIIGGKGHAGRDGWLGAWENESVSLLK